MNSSRRELLLRFIRFAAVGVLNTAFGYSIYAALVYLSVFPELALLLATITGVVFNFFTTGRLVFASRDNRLFLRFAIAYAIIYVANAIVLRLAILAGATPLIAQAVILPFSVVGTFAIMRAYVFPETKL